MTTNNLTPGRAAKQWAHEHPAFSGRVLVLSLTPAGKGGWMTKTKGTTFFVTGGKAAQTREDYRARTFNGRCEVCGRVYLERVLKHARAPDARTGQPAPEYNDPLFPGDVHVYGEGVVNACPECVKEHGLAEGDRLHWLDPATGHILHHTRHLTLARFHAHEDARLDIRGGAIVEEEVQP